LVVGTKTSQSYSRVWFFSWLALTCAILPAFRIAILAHIRDALDNERAFVFRALPIALCSDPQSPEEIAGREHLREPPFP